ncbi:MAG: hypothetical protein Q606_CBAC00283G0014, partial [Intestinibacter bartlettii DORA_8_9]
YCLIFKVHFFCFTHLTSLICLARFSFFSLTNSFLFVNHFFKKFFNLFLKTILINKLLDVVLNFKTNLLLLSEISYLSASLLRTSNTIPPENKSVNTFFNYFATFFNNSSVTIGITVFLE